MKKAAFLLACLLAVGCGSDDEPSADSADTTTTTGENTTTSTAAAEDDPYETYLRLAPAGEEKLGREDAQARAYLGCEQQWAPGTTDRALADAYRPTGICDR
jgi:hypothetical protein